MKAEDVPDTLDLALAASDCDGATVAIKPKLLSDKSINHVRGVPHHPQT